MGPDSHVEGALDKIRHTVSRRSVGKDLARRSRFIDVASHPKMYQATTFYRLAVGYYFDS